MLYFPRAWNTMPLQLCNDTVILYWSKLWAQKSPAGCEPKPCLQLALCDVNQGPQSADTDVHSHITNYRTLISPPLLFCLRPPFSFIYLMSLPFILLDSGYMFCLHLSLLLCCYSLMLLDSVINRDKEISDYFPPPFYLISSDFLGSEDLWEIGQVMC